MKLAYLKKFQDPAEGAMAPEGSPMRASTLWLP
jgi:hypothetical protein